MSSLLGNGDNPAVCARLVAILALATSLCFLSGCPSDQPPHNYTGVWQTHFGVPLTNFSTSEYSNGKLDGVSTTSYHDGSKTEEHYKNGKLHGIVKTWYSDGVKQSECTYVDGKRNGPYIQWDIRGNKVGEGGCKDNLPWEGMFTDYHCRSTHDEMEDAHKWGTEKYIYIIHTYKNGAEIYAATSEDKPLNGRYSLWNPAVGRVVDMEYANGIPVNDKHY